MAAGRGVFSIRPARSVDGPHGRWLGAGRLKGRCPYVSLSYQDGGYPDVLSSLPRLLIAWVLACSVACGDDHDLAGPTIKLAARKATPLPGQVVQSRATDADDDEEEKDYWEGVDFGADDFAEVRRFVKLFYIDPSYDKRMSWVTAANFALRSMGKPHELVPEDWWRAKKAVAKEAARYTGEPDKLKKSDLFVLLEVADKSQVAKDKPATALTPREIRQKKREARKRQEELEKSFARVPFTEADFDRVMDWIRGEEEGKNPRFKAASLYIAAAQGYLASLDPHSTIVSAKAWDESTKSTTDGSFEGIGAVLTKKGEDTIIETPMEGQPAYKAGLRAGDVIVAVDRKPVTGLELSKVVKRIRGSKGSTVVLTIRRMGEPRDLDIPVVREHIEVRNIQSRMMDRHPDVGYVKITGFVPTTKESLDAAVEGLERQTKGGRLRGLILDLRNNSGGLLQESVDVADDFLEGGVIVSVKNPSDRDEVYKAQPGGFTFPVVVLVNDSSASAAEILASAIQENQRGLVVGDRTFGKASVQTLLNPLLRRDYYIKLTVARYYSPQGRTIQVTGVLPDITVPPSPREEPPVGFREEDLAHHLTRLSGDYVSPNRALVGKVLECDKKMGIADQVEHSDPNPQVKPDYQLLKAADYLECLNALKEQDLHTAGAR